MLPEEEIEDGEDKNLRLCAIRWFGRSIQYLVFAKFEVEDRWFVIDFLVPSGEKVDLTYANVDEFSFSIGPVGLALV